MSADTYTEVGGVEWCVAHQGLVDECGDAPEGHCDMSDKCQHCHGSGWGDDELSVQCEMCGGDGRETCDIRTLYVKGDKS